MLTLAFLYLRSTNPQYNTMASILVKDQDGSLGAGQGASGLSTLQDMGILSGKSNVDNEMQIITSYTLIDKVVRDLQLYLNFSAQDGLKSIPLYNDSLPFNVQVGHYLADKLTDEQKEYEIVFNAISGYTIIDGEEKKQQGSWGVPLPMPFGELILNRDDLTKFWDSTKTVNLKIAPIGSVVDDLQKNLDAEIPNKQVSIIDLTLPTIIPEQGIDILNKLINEYQRASVEDNNRVADSTIRFIDDRLASVTSDLNQLEGRIQDFKQRNSVADLSAQSQALIASAGTSAQDLASQQVQLSVVNSLLDYMQKNEDSLHIVPASSALQNPSVSSNIDQYNSLVLQRERLLLSSTPENPMVRNIDLQIEGLKKGMIAGIGSMQKSLEVAIAKMQQNNHSLNDTLRQVPGIERTFLEYSRQQTVEQDLYVFLLQQKERTAISKSSTVSNIRVIDYARTTAKPIAPIKSLIYLLALVFGILIPLAWSFFRELLNNKIRTRQDIEQGTGTPILAEILHSGDSRENIVVTPTSRDPISEQFRILRTDLNFLLPNPEEKVILFTSSMPGEGKTFVSLNLSAVMALSGKKVVILEMDLRKPKLIKNLNISYKKGFSHYAIGQATVEEIICPVPGFSHLAIIPSGPIPPNPAELILLDKTRELFAALRKSFDYIIIDTTPNIVTDARLLARYADTTIYLIRVGHTFKEQLSQINKLWEEDKFPRLNLLVNDISSKKSGYTQYGNGQGYGYGYGYGYFGEDDKRTRRKWWRFWKRK